MFMPSLDRRPCIAILAGALLIASTAQPAFATEPRKSFDENTQP
jgi:hypothetical protein